mmetsp:Transcript_69381/g.178829  ORF Transcript_69381/g.178829 Transcript_69381/m.178829 type:complete len:220 (-) Transcript_69381:126-785(-)
MDSAPAQWYRSIPPVTRVLATIFVAVSALAKLKFIRVVWLVLHWPSVLKRFQTWRLFTGACYIGPYGLFFTVLLCLFVFFGSRLERSKASAGSSKSFLAFLLCQVAILDGIAYLLRGHLNIVVIGPSLVFACVWRWAHLEPDADVQLLSFSIKGRWIPVVFCVLRLFMGDTVYENLIGGASVLAFELVADLVDKYRQQAAAPARPAGATNGPAERHVLV